MAAFKENTAGWRLGASCATKLVFCGSAGKTGGRFCISKQRRQRGNIKGDHLDSSSRRDIRSKRREDTHVDLLQVRGINLTYGHALLFTC